VAGSDLAFALELADLADSLSLPRFRADDLRVETKPDLSPVTDADKAVERALRERIARDRPGRASSARKMATTAERYGGSSTRSTARGTSRAGCRCGRR
jgi:Archaeal fructose-1,6-bisphosphatase and related enzymes of inositol monophosphatase family